MPFQPNSRNHRHFHEDNHNHKNHGSRAGSEKEPSKSRHAPEEPLNSDSDTEYEHDYDQVHEHSHHHNHDHDDRASGERGSGIHALSSITSRSTKNNQSFDDDDTGEFSRHSHDRQRSSGGVKHRPGCPHHNPASINKQLLKRLIDLGLNSRDLCKHGRSMNCDECELEREAGQDEEQGEEQGEPKRSNRRIARTQRGIKQESVELHPCEDCSELLEEYKFRKCWDKECMKARREWLMKEIKEYDMMEKDMEDGKKDRQGKRTGGRGQG